MVPASHGYAQTTVTQQSPPFMAPSEPCAQFAPTGCTKWLMPVAQSWMSTSASSPLQHVTGVVPDCAPLVFWYVPASHVSPPSPPSPASSSIPLDELALELELCALEWDVDFELDDELFAPPAPGHPAVLGSSSHSLGQLVPWKRSPEHASGANTPPAKARPRAIADESFRIALRLYGKGRVKEDTLVVHEIYRSVQGESTHAGLPCAFVRLTGCNLRCVWCDTPQAFYGGKRMKRGEVLEAALALGTPLVELTGGEPLLQPGAFVLMKELCDAGKTVLVETSGEADVSKVDRRVHKIMDLKAPGSGESHRNRWSNLEHVTKRDEIKFVLASRGDYEWMRAVVAERRLAEIGCALLASTVFGKLATKDLVAWVLEDGLPVRVQLQMHKFIWAPDAQGV